MITTAKILRFDGTQLLLAPNEKISREIIQKNIGSVEIRLNDGRTISADQRRKIFAVIRDIAVWSGHETGIYKTVHDMGFLLSFRVRLVQSIGCRYVHSEGIHYISDYILL